MFGPCLSRSAEMFNNVLKIGTRKTFQVVFSESLIRCTPTTRQMTRLSMPYTNEQVWNNPQGRVPLPNKKKRDPTVRDIVPLDDLVDKRSLIWLENIHEACSTTEVFQALRELRGNLNEVHIARAISRLAVIAKQEPDSQFQASSTQVPSVTETNSCILADYQHKDFVDLCHLALRYASVMDTGLFLDVLKAIIDLRLPQSSAMVQTVLASAQQRLNHFNLDDLAKFASSLVRLQGSDERVRALLQAVILLVPGLISNSTNAMALNTILRTVGKQLDHESHVQIAVRLIAVLCTKEDTEKQQTVLDACRAITAFHYIGYRNVQFLRAACQILLNGIEYLPPTEMMHALHSLSGLRYYDPGLLEQAGDSVAHRIDEFTLGRLSGILKTYSAYRFLHKKLLNSVTLSLPKRSFDNESLFTFIGILSPFAKFQHIPYATSSATGAFNRIAEVLERQFASYPDRDTDTSQLVQLVAMLSMCGSFSQKLVDIAVRETYQEPTSRVGRKTLLYLRNLHSLISMGKPKPGGDTTHGAHPELAHILGQLYQDGRVGLSKHDKFRTSVAETLSDEIRKSRYSLAIKVAIGNGYTIDLVVSDLMREQRSIAIDLTSPVQYCANFPDRPLAEEALKMQHVKAMGYSYFRIRKTDWEALGSHKERVENVQEVLNLARQDQP